MSKKIIKLKQSELVNQVKKLISEQNENTFNTEEIYEKYFHSSCDSEELVDMDDPFAYGDALIDLIYDSALNDNLVQEENEDDFKNDLKEKYGEDILNSFKGSFEEEEEEMNEEGNQDVKQLMLGIDKDGKYYIVDPDTDKIIATTK